MPHHGWKIPLTPIGATDGVYNSEGDIVGANQVKYRVTWGDDTIRVFNDSADPHYCCTSNPRDFSDTDIMPILQE